MKFSQIVEAFTDLLDGGNSDPVNIHRETGLPEERCQEISDLFHRCMSEKCHGQKQSAQAHELFTGCLVICRSDGGLYRGDRHYDLLF